LVVRRRLAAAGRLPGEIVDVIFELLPRVLDLDDKAPHHSTFSENRLGCLLYPQQSDSL
jgi:hypothetical protein